MKILISGATGFIGKHLIKRLKQEGFLPYAVIRPLTDRKFLNEHKVKYFIFRNKAKPLAGFIKKEKISGIVHLASLFLGQHRPEDIPELINSNITFPVQLLEAAPKEKKLWFINTGTFWQHYQNKEYSPVNLYAATKQAFEIMSKFYQETSNLNFVTLKLNDTFGPDDIRPKIMNLWQKISQSKKSLEMSGGKQLIDINYIDNVIDAYIQMIYLLQKDKKGIYKGKTFAIKASRIITLRELAKIFEKAVNTKLNIRWGRRKYKEREVMTPWSKGKAVPGWKPRVSIYNGIKKTFGGK